MGTTIDDYINGMISSKTDKLTYAQEMHVREVVRDEIKKERRIFNMRMLTATQAGEVLNVSSKTIVNYIKRGKLKANKIDGTYRISHGAIEELLKSKTC